MNFHFVLFIGLLCISSNIPIVHSQNMRMLSEKIKDVLSDTDILKYDTFITRYMSMNEEDRCEVCMSVIVPIVEIIKQSNIQDAILDGLKTSCSTLGLLFRGTCNDFVDSLIPSIFSILLDVLPEANCGMTVGDSDTTMCSSDISYQYLEPQQTFSDEEVPQEDPVTTSIIIAAAGFLMSIFCTFLLVSIYKKKNNEKTNILVKNKHSK